MSEPLTAAQYRERLGEEWGTYVAATEIDIDGARAFNEGDPVPATHVQKGVVQDWQVARRGTKTAANAVTPTTENPKG